MKGKYKEYWVGRELKHVEDIKRQVAHELKKTNVSYQLALQDIQDDIIRNFVRYASGQGMTMEDAMMLADKTDVTRLEDKIKRYVAEKDFSDEANKDLKIYNLKIRISRLKLLKLEIKLEVDRLNGKVTNQVEEFLLQQAKEEYQRQATILGTSVNSIKHGISAIVNANYSLGASGSYSFSKNIWNNQEQLKNRLSETLNRVILQGKNPNQFNQDFRRVFDVSASQVGRLLITETARVQGEVQLNSFGQSGIKQYDVVYEKHACQVCIAAAQVGPYPLNQAVIGTNMYPFHPNCLCSIMPVNKSTSDMTQHSDSTKNDITIDELRLAIENKIGFNLDNLSNKIDGYSLNKNHPNNAGKAIVFKSALGYDDLNSNSLKYQVITKADFSHMAKKGDLGHGMRYEQIMNITGPNGKTQPVKTAWILENGLLKLTSMYVDKKGRN